MISYMHVLTAFFTSTDLHIFLTQDEFVIPSMYMNLNTLRAGWFWAFSAKKTPKRTWLCA